MKLLFDQNITFRIARHFEGKDFIVKQVNSVGLNGATDTQIWQYAQQNDLTIVTFDADFVDIAILKGSPPKIIWLRIGNTSTAKVAEILLSYQKLITDFVQDTTPNTFCLEIDE